MILNIFCTYRAIYLAMCYLNNKINNIVRKGKARFNNRNRDYFFGKFEQMKVLL